MVDADIAVMGLMQTLLHAKKLEPKQLHVVMIMLMVTRVGMMGLMQPVPVSNCNASGGQCQASNIHGQGGQQQQ